MIKKIFTKCFLIFLLFASIFSGDVRAKTEIEIDILQAYVSDDTLTLFTSGRLRYDSFKCTISNQNASLNASGKLSEDGVRIKTTVLVDISNGTLRDDIEVLLKKLVENKPANEEFKIVAFGDIPELLSDFTADRYDLAVALEKLELKSGKSKIYDAIYNTLPKLAPAGKQPAFYRTLLIVGRAEDAESDITKEELFLKLNSEHYPVDIVDASDKAPENKDLLAIARVSGGRYYLLNPLNSQYELAEMLGVNDYFYYIAQVPPALLDGSIRQTDIGDGINTMSLDLKFPVFAPAKKVMQPENPESGKNIEALTEPGIDGAAFYLGAGGAFLVLTVLMVAIGAIRNIRTKRKKFLTPGSNVVRADTGGETEFSGDDRFREKQYVIKLDSIKNPDKTWTFSIENEDELLIGRAENCRLRLEDRSVSREQCKITVEDAKLVVVHLSSTNKTAVNGNIADKSSPLQIGDTIKFGRESLRVDYIRTPEKSILAPSLDSLQNIDNINKGKTALLF